MGDNKPLMELKPGQLESGKAVVSNQEQPTEVVLKPIEADTQTPIQPTQETTKTLPKKSKTLTKIFAGFLIFIFLLFAGTLGYYYFAVYDQERFAREISTFSQDFEKVGQALNDTSVSGTTDYEGVIKITGRRKFFREEKKEDLTKSRPPLLGPFRNLKSDLNEVISTLIEVNTEAKSIASLMMSVFDLKDALEPKDNPFGQRTPTVKEVQDLFAGIIPEGQRKGDELFAKTPPRLMEVSFEELKASWNKAKPALSKFLAYVESLDASTPLNLSELNQPNDAQLKAAIEDINTFGRLVDAAINKNSAYDILSYRFAQGDLQAKMSEVGDVQKKIDELTKKYDTN